MSKDCGKSYRFMQKSSETGSQIGLIPVLCKSWSCETCRPNKAGIVKAFIRKNFSDSPVWMLTFTYYRKGTSLNAWKGIGSNINNMLSYARKYSGKFNYIRIVEPHKDGSWPHVHMLVDTNIATPSFVKNVTNWGFGWNFHCKPMDGFKASNYLSKYLSKPWPKGDADLLRQFARTRIVSNSRALGPIFKSHSDWKVIKLTHPWRGVHQLLNTAVNDLKANGALIIDVEIIGDGFLITADAPLTLGFVRNVTGPLLNMIHDAKSAPRICKLLDGNTPF